jgi:hypothetical protein
MSGIHCAIAGATYAVAVVSNTPGGGTTPTGASAPSFTFGSDATTVSSNAIDLWDTSCLFSNSDSTTGNFAICWAENNTPAMRYNSYRHTSLSIIPGTSRAMASSTTSAFKRQHMMGGQVMTSNNNKRGYATSAESTTAKLGYYTIVTSTAAGSAALHRTENAIFLGESVVSPSGGYHEWTRSGVTLTIRDWPFTDSFTWKTTASTTFTQSLSFTPDHRFYDCVKSFIDGTFWYGPDFADTDKDVLLIYQGGSLLVNKTDTFNYSGISSSNAKKGVFLSACINATTNPKISCFAHFDNTTKNLDLKLFTTTTSPLAASFSAKYTITLTDEHNVRLITAGPFCSFAFLLSSNSSGNTLYIRRVSATTLNNLTISSPTSHSITASSTEYTIGNTTSTAMVVHRSGSTILTRAFTIL